MKLNETRVFTTTLFKGFSVVAGALLMGIVAGAFGTYNLINTDHFTLAATISRLDKIEKQVETHATRDDVNTINARLDRIQTQLNKLIEVHIR